MLADRAEPSHRVDELVGHVLRVRGEVTQSIQPGTASTARSSSARLWLSAGHDPRVDRLAEEGHLADARRDDALDFADDLLQRAAGFLAAPVGHDAVGAEEVAAVDDRDVSRHRRRARLLLRQVVVRQLLEVVLQLGELRHDLLELAKADGSKNRST